MGVGVFILCTGHRWLKTKEQQPWNGPLETIPSRYSLNRKQRSLLLYVICVQYTKFWVEIWNPLIPGQIVNSFGQGKCTFDCQPGNFKKIVSTRSCMLRIEKLINFHITCMWTFHTHSFMDICLSCMYTNTNCEHFHKWFGTLYRDNAVLIRVLHIQ